MTNIPFPNIDYKSVDKAEDGELVYSKVSFFKKPMWVIKHKGKTYIFENYDAGLLAELIIKVEDKKR